MRSTIAAVLIFASLQSLDCLSGASNSRLNYFDIDLLRFCAEGKSGNVMVSPASIKSTLAMLLEGARGATAAEIQTALRLTPNKDDYRQQMSAFMKGLQVNTTSVTVQNANGLFVSKKLQLKKEYEMMAKRLYFSEVSNMDFNDPRTAADIINGWVSSKTMTLIPNIIDQAHITPQTELVVTNALYFKGTWLHEFEPKLTHADCFFKDGVCRNVAMMELDAELNYAYVDNLRAHAVELPYELVVTNALYFKGTWLHEFEPKLTHADCFFKDGVCRNVAMMELDAELNYAYVDNLRAHAVELPYEGKRYSMILLVPQDRDAGLALIRDLPYIGLLQISKLLQPSDVILTMPKFTVEYSDDMVAVLRNMRITTLFSPAANLSGIFADPRASGYLNSIFHKVYMQVDEKGTLAAAATAGMVVPLINSFVNLRIDRPFLFFIWDNEKGVVLFEGKIEEPTEFVELQNKFSNNGQETVKPQLIPSPTPGPYSQSIPIQQQVPIQPILNQPVSKQPIPPTNQPISAQPIQPFVNVPVNGQPIQPTNQPIQSTNQPITTQRITEPPTTNPPITRKSEQSWWEKVFG